MVTALIIWLLKRERMQGIFAEQATEMQRLVFAIRLVS